MSGRLRAERWWVFDTWAIVLCGGAIVAAFLLTPGLERVAIAGFELPELCGFKRWTGMSCPGCGLTRSWTYFAHGELLAAFRMNPVGPVLFLAAVLQVPISGYRLVRRWRRPPSPQVDPCPR